MTRVIALGDIHGQMAVFPRLDALQARYPEAVVVFIGDYVDGHKQGFAVLEEIHRRWLQNAERTIVLRGNHEQDMLDYLADPTWDNWLYNGGASTMREAVVRHFGHAGGTETNRHLVQSAYAGLLAWVRDLPLEASLARLRFVHAGYLLDRRDPVADTPDDAKLWAREEYWYGGNREPVFAHNPLGQTVVSGHTPTGYIEGRYDDGRPAKTVNYRQHPVFALRYPGEYPRLFIDGGNHGGEAARFGNLVVLDSQTGALLEASENPM